MKRLYQRLVSVYLISALLFILVFAASLYVRAREESGYYLQQLLKGVDSNLEEVTKDYEETVQALADQYITHAKETAYIIRTDPRSADAGGLEALREIMDVGAVSLIDREGTIIRSTDEALLGMQEDAEVLEELETAAGDAAGTAAGDAAGDAAAAVRVDEPDFWDRPQYFYVVVRAEPDQELAVRIDGDMAKLSLPGGKDRVSSVLRQATTEYGTSIFAVGKARGRILGITANNRQDIRIDDVDEGAGLLRLMTSLPQGTPVVLPVNGEYQSVVVRERDDMYLAAFTQMDRAFSGALATLVIGMAVVAVISAVTVGMIRYYIRKYLFDHFDQIQKRIYGILQGEQTSGADGGGISEFQPLLDTIVRLEREYMDKSAGMDRMEDELTAARNEAEYDHLTGLYNRSGFERRAEDFLKHPDARGAMILFDLDHFKCVNDTEGHPAGDAVLVRFAQCLSGTFRRGDVAGRLGGDEFAVLIPDAVTEETLDEKCRAFFERFRREFGDDFRKYGLSVSAGAVQADGSIRTYGKLYRCADTALYIAKYQGRDRYYINERQIDCMRRECIGCRADCPRGKILEKGDR